MGIGKSQKLFFLTFSTTKENFPDYSIPGENFNAINTEFSIRRCLKIMPDRLTMSHVQLSVIKNASENLIGMQVPNS